MNTMPVPPPPDGSKPNPNPRLAGACKICKNYPCTCLNPAA